MFKRKKTNKIEKFIWPTLAAILLIVVLVVLYSFREKKIDNFSSCEEAGGNIAESYPRQCFLNGQSFVEQIPGPVDEFFGLDKNEAESLMLNMWGECDDCDNVEIDVFSDEDNIWYAAITYSGLKDDSIKGQMIVNAVYNVEGGWVLGEVVKKQYQCQVDRGQQEFADDLCL